MFTLVKLTMKNFVCFKNTTIDFSPRGIYFISGYDSNTGGSNGSGKSSIISAICFALFGKTEKGILAKDLVRWGEKDLYVELTMEDDQKRPLVITRTANETSIFINGSQHTGGKTQTQDLINSTLGTNFHLFINSDLFSQGEVEFLSEQGDLDRKKLFKSLLRIGIIDKSYEAISNKLSELIRKADSNREEMNIITRNIIRNRDDLIHYEEEEKEFDSKKNIRIAGLRAIQSSSIEEKFDYNKYNKLKNDIVEYNKSYLENELKKVEDDIDKASQEYYPKHAMARNKFSTMTNLPKPGEQCPTCQSIIDKKLALSIHNKLLNEYNELIEQCDKIQKFTTSKNEEALSIRKKLEVISQKEQYLRELEMEKFSYESNKIAKEKETKNLEAQIKDIESQESPYLKLVNELKNREVSYNRELENLNNIQGVLTKDIDVYSFLKWVMSREGIIVDIIKDYLLRIQNLTNKYLSQLYRGSLSVKIDTSRILKNKSTKDEITINVFKNKRKVPILGGISEGQKQRINLCVLLALYWLCRGTGTNPFNFILLDEVLDLSLDDRGQEEFGEILSDLRKNISHIFIISHKKALSNAYNVELKVTMDTNGVSSVSQKVI